MAGSLADGHCSKFPLAEIDDPSDVKPADWVDEAKMVDPTASKPEDWDEDAPKMVADAEATQPEGRLLLVVILGFCFAFYVCCCLLSWGNDKACSLIVWYTFN